MTRASPLACSHCGLRLLGGGIEQEVGGVPGRFCCGGCLLAATVSRAHGDASVASALFVRLGLAAFFAMNVMMLTLPTYARHVYGESADGPLFEVLRWMAAALTVPVIALLGGPLLRSARGGLLAGRSTSDLLILLAVSAAFALSMTNLIIGQPDTYFDTTVMLLVIVTGGRFVESTAKARATEAIRRQENAAPEMAIRLEANARVPVEPDELVVGDVVEVRPGDAFPTDGVVVDGEGDVDESLLTGEARPQSKCVGSRVAGGTVSLDARLRVRVDTIAAESAHARIEDLLEEARAKPSEIERAVDRVASFVVPIVLVIAAVAGGYWGVTSGADEGVLTAVAVLVVACPCGLVLATPIAISRALGTAAGKGIVVRSAKVLERLASLGAVLFDKTGTLTEGALCVEAMAVRSGRLGVDDLLRRAAAVEEGVSHPIARAIVQEARRRGLRWRPAENVRVWPGCGASGVVDGVLVGVGTGELFRRLGFGRAGEGRVSIATIEGDEARVAIGETVVDGVEDTVARLRRDAIAVRLVTGDASPSGAAVRAFAPHEIESGLTPEEKLRYVECFGASQPEQIAMVGDGVNDAPALAAADVGIAVADATDLARQSADVLLVRDGVAQVPWLLAHARRTRRVIQQNLGWTLAYNAAAIALAASGRLDPLVSAAAMIGSSLLVIASSKRLAAPAPSDLQTDATQKTAAAPLSPAAAQ